MSTLRAPSPGQAAVVPSAAGLLAGGGAVGPPEAAPIDHGLSRAIPAAGAARAVAPRLAGADARPHPWTAAVR